MIDESDTKLFAFQAGISIVIVSPICLPISVLYNCSCNLPHGVTCKEIL